MEDDTYRFGEFSMSPRERRLFRNGESVLLPPKAVDAMHLLVRSHGNLVSRTEVFSTLWPGVHVEEANLTNIIGQLLAVLENRGADAIALLESENIIREPEGLFYLARHCGMLNAAGPAIHLVRRARRGGFWSSSTLERDAAFAGIRGGPEFDEEVREAQRLERHACQVFQQTLGQAFVRQGAHSV